jgi:hypothetical protein
MAKCIMNVPRVDKRYSDPCLREATVIVRETRTPRDARILGKSYTDHLVCARCAMVFDDKPRFAVIPIDNSCGVSSPII